MSPSRQSHARPEELSESRTPPSIRVLRERLDFLRASIEKIHDDIGARQALSGSMKTQLMSQIADFGTLLEEVRHSWRLGYNPALDDRRTHLERKLADLRHELRMNEVESWRDVIGLERELRSILEEYLSLQRILNAQKE